MSGYRSGSVSGSGSPPTFNHLFIDPLPTFPGNFMQIRSEIFAQSCYKTYKQTNKQRRLHILQLAEVNIPTHLNDVATLPCKMSVLKNRCAPELSEANSHARLNHSEQMLESIHSFCSLTKTHLQWQRG